MPVPVSILRLYFDCVECKKRFDTIDDCYAHEKTHSTTRSVETMTEEASVQSQPSGFIPVGASYASPKRSISPVDKEEEKKTNRRKPEIPQNSTNYDTEEDIQKIEELRCTTAMEPDLNATAPTIAQPSNLIAVARGLSAAVNTVAVDEVEENSSPQYKVINGRVSFMLLSSKHQKSKIDA